MRIRRRGHAVDGARLNTEGVRAIVRSRAAAAGTDGATGHSPRVGSAQSLVAAGAPLAETMQDGRWQSPAMVRRYAHNELATRRGTARLRYGSTW